MDQQIGGKGFGSLFSTLAKASKKLSKNAGKAIKKTKKASKKIDIDSISNKLEIASNNVDKAQESAGMFSNLTNTLIPKSPAPQVQKNENENQKQMNCICTCPVNQIQSGGSNEIRLEVYADKLINIVSAELKILITNRKKKIDKIVRGLSILSNYGFNINRNQDFYDLLYSNKFDNKPGFKTIYNALII